MKSLSEFLEVPEGVEFSLADGKYKIENNRLMMFSYQKSQWIFSKLSINNILISPSIKILNTR